MDIKELKIHHIGYLVKNIHRAIDDFIDLGFNLEKSRNGGITYDEYRDIDICFLVKEGYRVELVSPRNSSSVVGNLRKKIGNTPYHICYEVENLDIVINELTQKRYVIWEEPHEAPAIEERKVAFLINGQIGMIELVECKGLEK